MSDRLAELEDRLGDLDDRLGDVELSAVPPGVILALGAETPPAGWALCDGSAMSRAEYSALFAVIGTNWGDGSDDAFPDTDFNLPDLRGRFLRGADLGSERDEDRDDRVESGTGGSVGDEIGTIQEDAFVSHSHGVTDPGHNHGMLRSNCTNSAEGCGTEASVFKGNGDAYGDPQMDIETTGVTIKVAGGSETRPENAAVAYIIKL